MDTENSIKSSLLKLLNEGKSEADAINQLSEIYGPYELVKNNVNKWLEDFKSGNFTLNNKVTEDSSEKLTDEQIMDLIDKNPDLSLEKIARLAKCSTSTIRDRINKLENSGKSINYSKKNVTKLTDEYLIDLINKNPDLSMSKIAELAKCPRSTLQGRLRKLKKRRENVVIRKKENNKLTDEYLIDLVDKNPDLNMTQLATLVGTSQNHISNRIKQIKNAGKSIRYISKNNPILRSKPSALPNPKLTEEYLINLVNENPDLSMNKLAILADTTPVTLAKRIKQINSNGEKIAYRKRVGKKVTDEYIINLINENPDLSVAKLSELSNIPPTTLFNRINRINGDGRKVNYRKKDNKKFTDERLIDLINSNPDLSMEKLATLADTSFVTIYNRFKEINNDAEKAKHINKNT